MKTHATVRCGILGCGRTFLRSDMRICTLTPKNKLPCCPQCWEALGIPPDYKDTVDYEADYKEAQKPT